MVALPSTPAPMHNWFGPQKDYFEWQLALLREADAEFEEAWRNYTDPAQAWAKTINLKAAQAAHAKRGGINGWPTGAGKGRPGLALCILKGKETKRPSIWFTKKDLIGTILAELVEAAKTDPAMFPIHPLQLVPVQGTPPQKLLALRKAKALSGKAYVFLVANPESLLPPAKDRHVDKKAISDTDAAFARLPSLDPDEDEEDTLSEEDMATQRLVYEYFLSLQFSAAGCDEFHRYLGSRTTKVYQFIFQHLKADWRLGLSATAFPYKPKQFANAVNFFQPGRHWNSTAQFVRDNFITKGDRVKEILPGWELLWARLNRELIHTGPLSDVVELPPISFVQEYVELSPAQRRIYEGLKEDNIKWAHEQGEEQLDVEALTRILRMKQVCTDLRLIQRAVAYARPGSWLRGATWERKEGETSPKIDLIVRQFREDLTSQMKGVVYTQWSQSAKFVTEDFVRRGIVADYITGEVPSMVTVHEDGVWSARLQKCWDLNYGATELVTINDAAAEGINLQRANHIWILDLPWRLDRVFQAIGRIRRPVPPDMPGPFPVVVHIVIARDTLEERMLMPRLTQAAKAMGIFTRGKTLDQMEESGLFTGYDPEVGGALTRAALMEGL